MEPDSTRIAFLQLDEHQVPKYTVDHIPYRPITEITPYPAGDPNPLVRLGVSASRTRTVWVDLSAYAGTELLIVDVDWVPMAAVFVPVQDREQTWLDLNVADAASGHENDPARDQKVDPVGRPRWRDGRFSGSTPGAATNTLSLPGRRHPVAQVTADAGSSDVRNR